MKLPMATIEGNIRAGKTTLLERFEHSLSSEDKCKIKINHEPVDECNTVLHTNTVPQVHWGRTRYLGGPG